LRRPVWGLLTAGIVILVFVGIALAATTHFKTPFSPTGPTQLHSADGLSGLLAQIRNRFGDTMGYELVVYPEYAILDRADPQNNRHKVSHYYYRGGSWSEWDKSSGSSFDSLTDLSKFDATAVAAQLKGAPQALNINDATATYLIVEGAAGGSPALSIHVSDGDNGYLEINADGSVKQLHPPS
jgi:hypothetical protein